MNTPLKLFTIIFFAVLIAGSALLGGYNYLQNKERARIATEMQAAQIRRDEERKKRAEAAMATVQAEIAAENAKIDALLKKPAKK